MEHIAFLVEESSMEAALNLLVPRILGQGQSFRIHSHQGKADLLGRLPARLRGYRHWLPHNHGIVVVVDEDRRNCHHIKAGLESVAQASGFVTRSRARPQGGQFQVINWLAVEELEAWLLGDIEAVRANYPKVPPSLSRKAGFRDPDAIVGGTWEALERVLQAAGYHLGGLEKIRAAREVATHMVPDRNRSRSFQGFVAALRETLGW